MRVRARLLERVRAGGAHAEEHTARNRRARGRDARRAQPPPRRALVARFHVVRGANRALHSIRRERERQHGRRRPKGARRSGKEATWQRELHRAPPPPVQDARGAHRRRPPAALGAVRPRPDARRARHNGSLPSRLPRHQPPRSRAMARLDHFLAAVDHSTLPGTRSPRVKAISARADGLPTFGGSATAYS